MSTKLSDYDFKLPKHLIAQSPLFNRSDSKLLVYYPQTQKIDHQKFINLVDFLSSDDVLVLNNTKVIPARIIGEKKSTNAKIELLLLDEISEYYWECLVKPAKRIKLDDEIVFGGNKLIAKCIKVGIDGIRQFKFNYQGIFLEQLEKIGTMPLPPYITEKLDDQNRYQTIYSKISGSVASPTAGLHFSQELLQKIIDKKVKIVYVTLNVGLGTFKPVTTDNILNHQMHKESFSIDQQNADLLNQAKKNNKRIIAVGTTTVRTLETVYQRYQKFVACQETTEIFIYPGYQFQVIDGLITNFHLPKSTLMMLISALSSREEMLDVYQHAIDREYRFFSFGDSMFINFLKREDNGN